MTGLGLLSLEVFAERVGVTPGTIKAYQRPGLIEKPRRLSNVLLLFSVDDIGRAVLVTRCRELDFHMNDSS